MSDMSREALGSAVRQPGKAKAQPPTVFIVVCSDCYHANAFGLATGEAAVNTACGICTLTARSFKQAWQASRRKA